MAFDLPRPPSAQERFDAEGDLRLNSPIEVMRFTLVYRGPLSSATRNDTRRDEKHAIRQQLNPQMWGLWLARPVLKAEIQRLIDHVHGKTDDRPQDHRLFLPRECGPFFFVPLVTSLHHLVCELDILFLRAEVPGNLFTPNQAGDLDNRLKVLFDALRVPTDPGELPKLAVPGQFETPFFCLLESDSLITTVRLESERLLRPAPEHRNDVELVIRVLIKAEHVTMRNLDIIGAG